MRKIKYIIIVIAIITLLSGCTLPINNQKITSAINSVQKQLNKVTNPQNTTGTAASTAKSTKPAASTASKNTSNTSKPVSRIIPKPPANSNTSDSIKIAAKVKQVVVTPPASKQTTTNTSSGSTGNSGTTVTVTSDNTTIPLPSGAGSLNISGVPAYDFTVNSYTDYYNVIYYALYNFDSSICMRINNYNSNTYNLNTVDKVRYDHFDIDYGLKSVGSELYQVGDIYIMQIDFQYNFTKSQMTAMRNASEAKASQIIASIIKPGMSDLQKELAIHDYVVNHTAYDYNDYVKGTLPPAVYTDYGVLINGSAVCEGYAKAMFRLLNLVGIKNIIVVGTADGVAHTWNLVYINGVYTHVDATWDDPITPDRKQILIHSYFNISDAQMAKDHQWDTSQYPHAVAVPIQ